MNFPNRDLLESENEKYVQDVITEGPPVEQRAMRLLTEKLA